MSRRIPILGLCGLIFIGASIVNKITKADDRDRFEARTHRGSSGGKLL